MHLISRAHHFYRATLRPTQVFKLESALEEAPLKDRPTKALFTSKRPYLLATTLKVKINMLYDTGADLSCIDEEVFKQLNLTAPLTTDNHLGIATARYNHLQILGQVQLPLFIHGTTHQHKFFVIRNLTEPAILGIDFITKTGLAYNPTHQAFTWNEQTKP